MTDSTQTLMQGECLICMEDIPDASVDLILTDLPYGTTSNPWDEVIPMDQLWTAWKRVCKAGAPIVLFTQQPFTTTVAASNLKHLKTEWIWEKPQGTNFLTAKYYPQKVHENILVFCDRRPPYNPQKTFGHTRYTPGRYKRSSNYASFADRGVSVANTDGSRFPRSVQQVTPERGLHPTQKPVVLCEYLIRTYTDLGMTVFDCTMGSGTTGVAAVNTNRHFIGIEKDENYFKIAQERITAAKLTPQPLMTEEEVSDHAA